MDCMSDADRGPGGPYGRLIERWGAISDLEAAQELLGWDERTKLPPAGAGARSEQLATLARIRHELLIDDGLWELLEGLSADGLEPGSLESDTVAIAHRTVERARRVPASLRAEMTRAASLGEAAWERARETSDLDAYLPHLTRNVELAREYGACFPPSEHPYDPLLDEFEPGLPTSEAKRILGELRAGLVPIVAAVVENEDAVDDSLLRGEFAVEAQERLTRKLIAMLPLDDGTWRLDTTVHPFMASTSRGDVRLTTRYEPADVSFAMFSALHEAGHGLYEAGVPEELARTPIGSPMSLSFHESQSRLWENWVGRSRPFLAQALPLLGDELDGGFGSASAEELYRAANKAQPSLIRVEADEVTYNLHIALRFELELELIEGTLEADELAEAWIERTREYLGLETPDHKHGVMQDVHWAGGAFGYFPTYALGNVIAAQLWDAAGTELGDIDELIAAGELRELRRWLVERVHRHGARYLPAELAERAVGGPMDPEPLLRRLRSKYGELYGF
jgi:carboxypeptidase Taq